MCVCTGVVRINSSLQVFQHKGWRENNITGLAVSVVSANTTETAHCLHFYWVLYKAESRAMVVSFQSLLIIVFISAALGFSQNDLDPRLSSQKFWNGFQWFRLPGSSRRGSWSCRPKSLKRHLQKVGGFWCSPTCNICVKLTQNGWVLGVGELNYSSNRTFNNVAKRFANLLVLYLTNMSCFNYSLF